VTPLPLPLPLPPPLASYATSLVAYDVDLGGPGMHRGLPSPTLTIVLPLDVPLDVGWGDEEAGRRREWSIVAGLHARPAAIRHGGHQRGVQLAMTPSGARALLGVPAGELAGALVRLDDVLPVLRDLPERVAEAQDPARAARVVAERLRERAAAETADPGPPAARRALALLAAGVPASQVARDLGCSRRRLHALVREETGLSPTAFRRVARFDRARVQLTRAARAGGRVRLASVAADAGYADQAHLSREFADLAGCPPTTWLREEFPFVQDVPPRGGGD
jgi:AraC-like DNA-binding protein